MTASTSAGGRDRRPLTLEFLQMRYSVELASAQQIADETGWSSQVVRDRLRHFGIPLRAPGVKPGTASLDMVKSWLAEGMAVAVIARRAGYSQAGIYALMDRHQLSRPVSDNTATIQTAAQLYRDGNTLTEVAAEIGRSTGWVRARLLEQGIAIRANPRRLLGDPAVGVEQMASWYAEGVPVVVIARRAARSPRDATALLRKHGITVQTGRRPSVADTDRARILYSEQGLTLAETAAVLGCSTRTVARTLRDAGVAIRPSGVAGRRVALDVTCEELRELYVGQNLTMAQIAARLDCGRQRVADTLDEHNIPRRTGTPPLDADADTLHQLYVVDRLDDPAIGHRLGVPAWRVTLRRRELGVHRPASAPPRPAPRATVGPDGPGAEVLQQLYIDQGLTLAQIGSHFHTSSLKVRAWLQAARIPIRPRATRSHRRPLDPDQLRSLYLEREWSAQQIADELNTTIHVVLRALHQHAIPVRSTRATHRTPSQLLTELYADQALIQTLRRHRVPLQPEPGTITERFPTPAPLEAALLRDLYETIGLSTRQIELVTGQPHEQILDAVHAAGITVRRDEGPSPWSSRRR